MDRTKSKRLLSVLDIYTAGKVIWRLDIISFTISMYEGHLTINCVSLWMGSGEILAEPSLIHYDARGKFKSDSYIGATRIVLLAICPSDEAEILDQSTRRAVSQVQIARNSNEPIPSIWVPQRQVV